MHTTMILPFIVTITYQDSKEWCVEVSSELEPGKTLVFAYKHREMPLSAVLDYLESDRGNPLEVIKYKYLASWKGESWQDHAKWLQFVDENNL